MVTLVTAGCRAFDTSWQQWLSVRRKALMYSLFPSKTIITAKLLFQQVSHPNHLSVRSQAESNDGGMPVRNRWSVEKEKD